MAGPFAPILERAIALRGEAELEASLPSPASAAAMRAAGDDAYLREMARCVFRSGFVWQVVENKWDGFENAFAGFNPKAVAHFADERLEAIAQNASVIRNLTKIRATRDNAGFVLREAERHGSFGAFIADWPGADIVGLQLYLRKEGSRLGGHTGQYFLRFMGKDTFMFSKDVVSVLVAQGVVGKEPTSKKALTAVQEAFNAWQAETGRPFCQLSRIMAASVG
tara:strand:+ start:1023 stop:1691 length:669 start_codon:yes stop_codon:yes gene_type:complete